MVALGVLVGGAWLPMLPVVVERKTAQGACPGLPSSCPEARHTFLSFQIEAPSSVPGCVTGILANGRIPTSTFGSTGW
jgi:hypothetical protein